MLDKWLQSRRDRKALDYSALTTGHPIYGRPDGDDGLVADLQMADELLKASGDELTAEDGPPIDNNAIIAALEAQLNQALDVIQEQNAMLTRCAEITVATRSFVELVTQHHAKSGEGLFRLNGVELTDPLGQTLQFRFADMAAALNGVGRPVAPRLAEGTVH